MTPQLLMAILIPALIVALNVWYWLERREMTEQERQKADREWRDQSNVW